MEKQCCSSGSYGLVLRLQGDSNPSVLDITFSLCYEPISDVTQLTVQNERPENVWVWDLWWHSDFHVRYDMIFIPPLVHGYVKGVQHCIGESKVKLWSHAGTKLFHRGPQEYIMRATLSFSHFVARTSAGLFVADYQVNLMIKWDQLIPFPKDSTTPNPRWQGVHKVLEKS